MQKVRQELRGDPEPYRTRAFRWEMVGRYVFEQIDQGQLDWDLETLMDEYLEDTLERRLWRDGV